MAYTRKTTFNIDGIIIYSSLFIPLNCKDLPSLNSEWLDNLVKTYDRFWTIAQFQSNVDTINNQCFSTLANDPNFP